MAIKEISLFPIPNLVSFPGTVVPLHVFEPRYRQMIKESVSQGRWIGVSHTQKMISSPKKNQTPQEALQNNQATFEPYPIFSAGPCIINEVSADGRIYCDIEMKERFKFIKDIQTLPYRIVEAETLADGTNYDNKNLFSRKELIRNFLVKVFETQEPSLKELLCSKNWAEMNANEFSFKVFNFLKLDPEVMQDILECTNPEQRIQILTSTLNPHLKLDQ